MWVMNCSLSNCLGVTFLFPNKKVTKEIGLGEGARARSRAQMRPPPKNPLPRRTFAGFAIRQTANRNICGIRVNSSGLLSLGGEVHRRGRLCEKPPPMTASFGSFLAGTRKEHDSSSTNCNLSNRRKQPPHLGEKSYSTKNPYTLSKMYLHKLLTI